MRVKVAVGMLVGAAAMAASMTMASPAGASNIGNEGCTPGYWKNHTEAWEGYTPATVLDYDFNFPANLAGFADDTMLQALKYKGGSDLDGAVQILMRAATAAFLNAEHEGVGYPLRRYEDPGNMQAAINALLAGGDRQAIIDYASYLDGLNNLGCPW